MKAATYVSAGNLQLIDQPKPVIKKPTDAIVRLVKTTICGTDLHILGGDVPACKEGTILGHEGIGIVEEVGDAVTNFKVGDKVIFSKYAGNEVKLDDEEYIIVKQSDILAIVE